MNKTLQSCIAELFGTFALTFIGAGAIITTQAGGDGGLIAVALAHGLVISAAVYATGHISGGHINPAVTIAMWANGKMKPPEAAAYIVAQLLGAVIAALSLNCLFPAEAVEAAKLGATLGSEANMALLGPIKTMGIEIFLTIFLIITIFAVAVDNRGAKQIYGFAIGLTVCFDILAAGPLTGASMNPARSFGPALVGGYWDMHWVYWLGPIVGALIGAFFYQKVLMKKTK